MKCTAWLAVGLGLFVAALPVLGETEERDFTLEGLGFLAGCWSGPFGRDSGMIEEFYTSPSANLILGTTRYLREGTAVQYEFTRIESAESGVLMTPYPGGEPSKDAFRLTSLQDGVAVFEAPEHDYPKRIIYRANRDGTRTARIDGGIADREGQEWELEPIECPRSASSKASSGEKEG